MALTVAEIVSIIVALIEHAPEYVAMLQKLKEKDGLSAVLPVPLEHQAAVQKALESVRARASANVMVNAIAEHMGS